MGHDLRLPLADLRANPHGDGIGHRRDQLWVWLLNGAQRLASARLSG
jgi:hypothetical protein